MLAKEGDQPRAVVHGGVPLVAAILARQTQGKQANNLVSNP
jgi:hypothetical protein